MSSESSVPASQIWWRILFWLLPYVALCCCAFYLKMHWDEIPERFPCHWGADGKPNGWMARTPAGVGFPLLLAAAINMVVALVAAALLRAFPPRYSRGRAMVLERRARLVIEALFLGVCYLFTVHLAPLSVWMPFLAENGGLPARATVLVPVWLGLLAGVLLALSIWHTVLMAAARREDLKETRREIAADDRDNDRFWKWGMVYYNPDDPSVMVPKRFGMGWTSNMARWQSWALLAAVLLLPILLAAGIFFFASPRR